MFGVWSALGWRLFEGWSLSEGRASLNLFNAMSRKPSRVADARWWPKTYELTEMNFQLFYQNKSCAFQPPFLYKTHILLQLQSLASPGKPPVNHSSRETSGRREGKITLPFSPSPAESNSSKFLDVTEWEAFGVVQGEWDSHINTCLSGTKIRMRQPILQLEPLTTKTHTLVNTVS